METLGRRHEATLKKLVQHQRTINTDDESPYFEGELDLPDQGILDRELHEITEDPSRNPFMSLNLECIGVACVSERLVRTQQATHLIATKAQRLIICLCRNLSCCL